jgi:predicted acylesterase/phospholipase RssA
MVTLCKKGFIEKLVEMDVSQLFSPQFAVAGFHRIQEFLETQTVEKIGHYVTLSQLKEQTGKTLVCSTFNLSARRMEYLSPQTHPDLPCITALRMSCSLPLLFPLFAYNGSLYVDGGIVDDFPLSQIDEEYGAAMGICVVDLNINVSSVKSDEKDVSTTTTTTTVGGEGTEDNHRKESSFRPSNLMDLLYRMFSIFVHNLHGLTVRLYGKRCRHLFNLKVPSDVPLYRFYLTTTDKFNLFSTGYENVRTELEYSKKNKMVE